MCGRFTLTLDQEALSAAYGVERLLIDHSPRYNIAPTQDVTVLLGGEGGRRIEEFRWGLIPSWAKDSSIGNRMINARSETVAEKPSFRAAWKHRRRCLVLADGFFEWKKPDQGHGPKQPYWIQMEDRRPFGFAGLWERWKGNGEEIRSCTILTGPPNELLRPIHDRMPVILGHPEEWDTWVDPEVPPEEMEGMMRPFSADEMRASPVSSYVNRPGNEGPECVERVEGE